MISERFTVLLRTATARGYDARDRGATWEDYRQWKRSIMAFDLTAEQYDSLIQAFAKAAGL
jgi:hypothetical protein